MSDRVRAPHGARSSETLEVYIYHATRMAWLAERALEHESGQSPDLIRRDYAVSESSPIWPGRNRLTADLEALRAESWPDRRQRFQEIKWTMALSQLDSIASADLRQPGPAPSCCASACSTCSSRGCPSTG